MKTCFVTFYFSDNDMLYYHFSIEIISSGGFVLIVLVYMRIWFTSMQLIVPMY